MTALPNSSPYAASSHLYGLLMTQIKASRAAGSAGAVMARSIIRRLNAVSLRCLRSPWFSYSPRISANCWAIVDLASGGAGVVPLASVCGAAAFAAWAHEGASASGSGYARPQETQTDPDELCHCHAPHRMDCQCRHARRHRFVDHDSGREARRSIGDDGGQCRR